MKKNTTVVKKEKKYDINILINNTALIYVGEKSGLLNVKTNEIIGEINNFHTTYDQNGKFFTQILTIDDETSDGKLNTKKKIRIYDALNEVMIMDGWDLVATYKEYYELISVRNPTDNKLHLFDKFAWRKTTNIFDIPLDDIQLLYRMYNDTFFVLTKQGKKALYYNNCYDKVPQLRTPFEFDNIERMGSAVVYTKGNEKYFVCGRDEKDEKVSPKFEEITTDEEENNIIYAKNGITKYAYNTYSEDLLLQMDCDEIKCIVKHGDSYNNYNGSYYFLFKKNNKYGLVISEISNEIRKQNNDQAKTTILLDTLYDEIKYEGYYDSFYLINGENKVGLFKGNAYHNKTIEAKYDDINCWGGNMYSLHTGDLCDLVSFTAWDGCKLIESNCTIEKSVRQGLIYKKNGLLGISFSDSDYSEKVISPEYDKIENFEENYYLLEKNKLKGVLHLGEIIIPVKYKKISYGGKYNDYSGNRTIYFALKRKDNKFELAKRHNYSYRSANKDSPIEFVTNHSFDSIEFLNDIMVFKDEKYTYIYDYNEKLLKTLPPNSIISSCKDSKNDDYYDYKNYSYCIDGTYYFYKEGKFEEMHTEMQDYYITTYEINNHTFEIKTFNKKEHDGFCKMIEEKEDEKAEAFLLKLIGKKYGNYPSITITLVEV